MSPFCIVPELAAAVSQQLWALVARVHVATSSYLGFCGLSSTTWCHRLDAWLCHWLSLLRWHVQAIDSGALQLGPNEKRVFTREALRGLAHFWRSQHRTKEEWATLRKVLGQPYRCPWCVAI